MAKTTDKLSIDLFIPISNLGASWKGKWKDLPPNEEFSLIIDYPLGGNKPVIYKIKTGKSGMNLIQLLAKIGSSYEDLYDNADRHCVFGHDIDDLSLGGIIVDFKKKRITLGVDS